jgi:hypothetical protein
MKRDSARDDGVEIDFMIVGQVFWKLYPLCRQRYRRSNHLTLSPSPFIIQAVFELQTHILPKACLHLSTRFKLARVFAE